jgi:triacylglycerol lipase
MIRSRGVVALGLVVLLGVLGFLAQRGPNGGVETPQPSAARAGDPPQDTPDSQADGPIVVLVHGLGRGPISMAPLGRGLVQAGFRVVNLGYPSWTLPADSLVALLADSVAGCCADEIDDVNFVTHSLGGILVRQYLQEHSPEHRGRVVMLAPPNGGSEIIDFLHTVPGLRALLGPTGGDLGTDSTSLPNQLGPATFPLGVITGDRSLNPIYSWLIPGPDDGKVSVERARIEGAKQLLVAPFSHSFIMTRESVLQEVTTFLTTGSFSVQALEAWAYIPLEAGPQAPDNVPPAPENRPPVLDTVKAVVDSTGPAN